MLLPRRSAETHAGARSLGRHRLYSEETVNTLRVIKAAQRLGFTLDEVTELLEAGRHHHGTGLQARTEAKLAEVDQKIADLQVIGATLIAARDAGCDDLVQCAGSECCPIPFVQIALRPSRVPVPPLVEEARQRRLETRPTAGRGGAPAPSRDPAHRWSRRRASAVSRPW